MKPDYPHPAEIVALGIVMLLVCLAVYFVGTR